VNQHGENVISVARSSNDELSPADVIKASAAIRRARCVVLQLEIPLATVKQAISIARDFDVPVLLNPAPARRLSRSLLRQIDILTPNELELAALTNRSIRRESDLEKASLKLVSAGVKHVLVTRGPRRVCWSSGRGVRWVPVPKVKAIDSVGAGDCFSGTLAAAIALGESMDAAVTFAIAAATVSVTRRGAQSSMPTRREILRALGTRL
jgi:ribokinase